MLVKCTTCGAATVVDGPAKGMNVRCSSCGTVFECTEDCCEQPDSANTLECEECGLKCQAGTEKCPACGGKIISVVGSERPQPSIQEGCTTKVHESTDAFLQNWEKNLGAYSFSVVLGLASTILWAIFINILIFRTKFFGLSAENFLWWGLVFECVSNIVMSLIALVLLLSFFRRSRFVLKGLPFYFKFYGVVILVDLLWAILAADAESLQITNIREFGAALGCFFWAWYFKRIFTPLQSQVGCREPGEPVGGHNMVE